MSMYHRAGDGVRAVNSFAGAGIFPTVQIASVFDYGRGGYQLEYRAGHYCRGKESVHIQPRCIIAAYSRRIFGVEIRRAYEAEYISGFIVIYAYGTASAGKSLIGSLAYVGVYSQIKITVS